MQSSNIKKFLNALKTAKIDNWEAVTDTPTHFYNNGINRFNIYDEAEEIVYNFGPSIAQASVYGTDQIVVKGADIADIHEVVFGGNISQVKEFIKAYGLNIDENQNNILVKIQGNNYNLKPVTGDYKFAGFKELTSEEVNLLSDEKREEYETQLEEYKVYIKEKENFKGCVQVTV